MHNKAIQISVFGRYDCSKCETTKNKLSHFLSKWGLAQSLSIIYHYITTVDGLAEGVYYQVNEIPTTLILDLNKIKDDGRVTKKEVILVRGFGEEVGVERTWQGEIPEVEELKEGLEKALDTQISST